MELGRLARFLRLTSSFRKEGQNENELFNFTRSYLPRNFWDNFVIRIAYMYAFFSLKKGLNIDLPSLSLNENMLFALRFYGITQQLRHLRSLILTKKTFPGPGLLVWSAWH